MPTYAPFDRYLRGTQTLLGTNGPMDAGSMAVLANNAGHLARQLACRTLASHPGFIKIWRQMTHTPNVPMRWDGVNWDADQDHTVCLGTHPVYRYGPDQWPTVVLRGRWQAPMGFTLYGNLWITTPLGGERAPTPQFHPVERSASLSEAWRASHSLAALSTLTTASTAMSDFLLAIPLPFEQSDTDAPAPDIAMLNAGGDGVTGYGREGLSVVELTVWAGFACTSNNVNAPARAVGLSLGLEPPM